MSYISPHAHVHDTARIMHGAYIGPNVTIGPDCLVQPGASIGSPGFGYDRKPAQRSQWQPKPHNHGVILDEDVHIGANACIDAGSWRDTRIGHGTRIDNLVHLAHNVRVGANCMIVAHAMLAGSVSVDDGAWIGPSASIHQHRRIGARALVGMGAVVLEDVEPHTTVAGVPAKVIDATRGVRDVM